MDSSDIKAFSLLQSLEQRGRDHAAALPVQDEVHERWAGIGFRLGGWRLVASMGDVVEILTYPQLSPVPRTKAWVRGIANVRGNLLPIMDLSGFLEQRSAALTRLSRVLVVQKAGVTSGLLVDEVLGMRQFDDEERVAVPGGVGETLRPYVSGAYRRDDGDWLVFSIQALVSDPQFLKVGS